MVFSFSHQSTHVFTQVRGICSANFILFTPFSIFTFYTSINIDFDTKMKSLQSELKELLVEEEKSKADLLAVFKELGYEIEL